MMTMDQRLRLLENVLEIAKKDPSWTFEDILVSYNHLLKLITE